MAVNMYSVSYWVRRRLGLTEVRREKLRMLWARLLSILMAVIKHRMGGVGVGILVFFIVLAFIVPFLPIADPNAAIYGIKEPISWEHPFGTDQAGKDIFSRVIWGSQVSLLVGLLASVIAAVLGTAIGLASGYVGGRTDEGLMRINDIFLSLPWLALLIILAAVLGRLKLEAIVLAIGLTSWNFTARVVRAQVLSVKERVFVERAKTAGASRTSIIMKHIFPNVFPLVFANTILTVAIAILSESSLAYLGRTDPTMLSWGVILNEADEGAALLTGSWAWIVMPGLALVFVILGFSLLGYALDEILNPRLRER